MHCCVVPLPLFMAASGTIYNSKVIQAREQGEFQIPPCPLLLQQELIIALLSLSSFTEYQLLGCAGMGTGYKGH